MFELLAAIFEAIVAAISALIEAIASLFAAGGETLGAGEALVLLFVVLAEFVAWGVLWLVELAAALFQWRKPRRIARPRFWRPKPKAPAAEAPKS